MLSALLESDCFYRMIFFKKKATKMLRFAFCKISVTSIWFLFLDWTDGPVGGRCPCLLFFRRSYIVIESSVKL